MRQELEGIVPQDPALAWTETVERSEERLNGAPYDCGIWSPLDNTVYEGFVVWI